MGSFPELKCFSNANYTVKGKKNCKKERHLWFQHHFGVVITSRSLILYAFSCLWLSILFWETEMWRSMRCIYWENKCVFIQVDECFGWGVWLYTLLLCVVCCVTSSITVAKTKEMCNIPRGTERAFIQVRNAVPFKGQLHKACQVHGVWYLIPKIQKKEIRPFPP